MNVSAEDHCSHFCHLICFTWENIPRGSFRNENRHTENKQKVSCLAWKDAGHPWGFRSICCRHLHHCPLAEYLTKAAAGKGTQHWLMPLGPSWQGSSSTGQLTSHTASAEEKQREEGAGAQPTGSFHSFQDHPSWTGAAHVYGRSSLINPTRNSLTDTPRSYLLTDSRAHGSDI